jgi:hypothetical protein
LFFKRSIFSDIKVINNYWMLCVAMHTYNPALREPESGGCRRETSLCYIGDSDSGKKNKQAEKTLLHSSLSAPPFTWRERRRGDFWGRGSTTELHCSVPGLWKHTDGWYYFFYAWFTAFTW